MVKRKRPHSPTSDIVEQAVISLVQWRKSVGFQRYPSNHQEDQFLFLLFYLNNIPTYDFVNTYHIPLPHSLLPESPNLCLIIDDTDEEGPTKREVKEKIESWNIPISYILKFSKLKVDYCSSPLKRDLCDCFDVFFADKSMIPFLGGMFWEKVPVGLDLKGGDWKGQIERACSSTLLSLMPDSSHLVRVGKVSMDVDEIVDNVVAACNGIAHVVPNHWGNIGSIHLKLLESHSLPIYQNVPF